MRDAEETLLRQWGKGNESFVSDGVVDWDSYLASSPRLLFVLKEVNDIGGGGWDLRQFLREGGRSQTWDTVTRWIIGIRSLHLDLNWQDIELLDQAKRKEVLSSIAAMNLKKIPGSHTAIWKDVSAAAFRDRELICQQVELYKATLTICCGVGDAFVSLTSGQKSVEWKRTSRGIYYLHQQDTVVIAFTHPEARAPKQLLYYGLIDAVKEIFNSARCALPPSKEICG